MFIEHKLLYSNKGHVPTDPQFLLPVGKAEIMREGRTSPLSPIRGNC